MLKFLWSNKYILPAIKCHLPSRISHKMRTCRYSMHTPFAMWYHLIAKYCITYRILVRVGRVCGVYAVWLFRVALHSMSGSWGQIGLLTSARIYCYCFWFYAYKTVSTTSARISLRYTDWVVNIEPHWFLMIAINPCQVNEMKYETRKLCWKRLIKKTEWYEFICLNQILKRENITINLQE